MTLAALDAELHRVLAEEGIVVRGHDIAARRQARHRKGRDMDRSETRYGARARWRRVVRPGGARRRARGTADAKALRANAGPLREGSRRSRTEASRRRWASRSRRRPGSERRSKDEVRNFLDAEVQRVDARSGDFSGIERTYRRFGLISDTLQLRPFMLELLTAGRLRLLRPVDQGATCVDGADPAMVGVTVTHELVHALQDQYLNLDSIQKVTGDNDRQVAAQAVIEGAGDVRAGAGNARLEQSAGNAPRRLGSHSRHDSRGQSSMPVFSSAPMDHPGDADLPVL